MFFELFISVLLGILIGIVTGIIPGIHINLLSTFILSVSPFLLSFFSPFEVSSFILAIAITHTFLDVIPTTFLGIPEADSPYLTLPSQKMVLEGRAYEAIFLSTFGALLSLLLAFFFIPIFLLITKILYPLIETYIGWILLLLCIYLILKEKNKLWAGIIFFLSGTLGLMVLSLPIKEGLFPLFSGLFGISTLFLSLQKKPIIPLQKQETPDIEKNYKAIPCATFVGWIASFMPGLGPAQMAMLSTHFLKLNDKGYLILIGGLSTVNTLLALLSFYLFKKTRSGVLVNISELLTLDTYSFFLLLFIGLFVSGIATLITLYLARHFSLWICKMNYFLLSLFIISFILLLTFFLTGFLGILILITATAIGILPEIKHIAKSHMMGCLLIPVLFYYLL